MTERTQLESVLGGRLLDYVESLNEVTIVLDSEGMIDSLTKLRESGFEQLIDLCGVDYLTYGDGQWEGRRFASVYHLLSVANNERVRVRIFAKDDEFPILDSCIGVWNSASWYEREAFDLFGIVFSGHPDLRRILTDYGFIGNPFRKDFPLSGNVEMRYDEALGRVVYQPVSIPPREITPRIVREPNYGEA
ncbi:MAG TPA: NADH-quinone oxidoreductase subunit C [Burkholderiales bacterium]|nr:NADH-quinone oxidoreductase subunit C [Burkholderiales bacterium]